MKNFTVYFLASFLALSACKKSADKTADIQYQFASARNQDQYKLVYADNNGLISENVIGHSWSKTVHITMPI